MWEFSAVPDGVRAKCSHRLQPSYNRPIPVMTPFKPEVLRAIEACRSHAQDLFEGAKLLREKSLPNLAYHLTGPGSRMSRSNDM
jgi:hypothetical protein